MAETAEIVQETTPTVDKVLEALVFNEPIPTSQAAPATTQTTTTTEAAPVTTTTETAPETSFDEVEYLKQNYGVESADDLKAQIEEYRKLKANPVIPAEISFSDEQSKKIHHLLREGKTKEVKSFLEAQELLADVDTLDTEKQLKLYIKMQNPLFDQELIDDEYDSLYKIDESKFENELKEVDQLKLRKEKLRLQQRVQNDAIKANEYFSQYKTKLELPDINTSQQIVDQDYEDYKASTAKSSDTYNNVIVPSLNSLKETDVQFGFKVDDPNNQMNFDVSIVAEKNDFDKARNSALSFSEYISRAYYDEKGTFQPNKLVRAILLDQNFDKYVQTAARQAVNAERKRVVDKESTGGGVKRDFNTTEQLTTEVDQQAKMAFSV